MPNSKIFQSQLTEDDQQHLNHCVKKLLTWLRASESRLQSYNAVNAEAEDQSVLKLITNLKETLAMTEDTINELITRHGLPDELGHIDEEYRKLLKGRAPRESPQRGWGNWQVISVLIS